MVQPPASDAVADCFGGRVADGGGKAIEDLPGLAPHRPTSKRVAQEVEADVIVITSATRVLAVHDAGLARMELQAETRQPLTNGAQHPLCFDFAPAVNHRIIRVALETDRRELPGQPDVERVVEEEVGQQGRARRTLWGAAVPSDQ